MDTSQDSADYAEDREAKIREKAHRIWIENGHPEGMDLEHWMEAERDVGGEAPQPRDLDESLSVLGRQGQTDKPSAGA